MLLCIRPSLVIGIHRGTLAYIRWVRLECGRGERSGEGNKVVGKQLHVYILPQHCMDPPLPSGDVASNSLS